MIVIRKYLLDKMPFKLQRKIWKKNADKQIETDNFKVKRIHGWRESYFEYSIGKEIKDKETEQIKLRRKFFIVSMAHCLVHLRIQLV